MSGNILLALLIVSLVLFLIGLIASSRKNRTIPQIEAVVNTKPYGIPPTYIGSGQVASVSYDAKTGWTPSIVPITKTPYTPATLLFNQGGSQSSSGALIYGVGQNLSSSAFYNRTINKQTINNVSCTSSTAMAWAVINNTPYGIGMNWLFTNSSTSTSGYSPYGGAITIGAFKASSWDNFKAEINSGKYWVPIYYGQSVTFTSSKDTVGTAVSCPDDCPMSFNPLVDILIFTVSYDALLGKLRVELSVFADAVSSVYNTSPAFVPTALQLITQYPSMFSLGNSTFNTVSQGQTVTLSKYINSSGDAVPFDANLAVPWVINYTIDSKFSPGEIPVIALVGQYQQVIGDSTNTIGVILAVLGGRCQNPTFCSTLVNTCAANMGEFYGSYLCNPLPSPPSPNNSNTSACSIKNKGIVAPSSQTIGWLESHYQGFQDVLWAFGIGGGSGSSPDKGLLPGFSNWYGGSANINPDTPIPLYLGQQFTVVQLNGSSSQNAMTGVTIAGAQSIPLNVNNFSGFLQINVTANSVDSSGNVVATYLGNQVLVPTVSYLPPVIPAEKITKLMLAASMNLIPPNNTTAWSGQYCSSLPNTPPQSSLKCSGSYKNTQITLYTANGQVLRIGLDPQNTYASTTDITTDLGQTLQAQISYTWYGTTRTYNIPFMFNGMVKYQLPLTNESLSFVANVTDLPNLQKIGTAKALTATLNATLRQTAANISGMFVTPPNAYAGASGEACGAGYSGQMPPLPSNSSYQQGYLRDLAIVVGVSFSAPSAPSAA